MSNLVLPDSIEIWLVDLESIYPPFKSIFMINSSIIYAMDLEYYFFILIKHNNST